MKQIFFALLLVVVLPFFAAGYLRTSRFFAYFTYSFSLGKRNVKIINAGIKFARTTQDELPDSDGNREFGSARIGLECGLLLGKTDALYLRMPYDFFNYGKHNGTGRQQTFSLSLGPGYVFSKTDAAFFLGLGTAAETSSLLSARFMRSIGFQYLWFFSDSWKSEGDPAKKKLTLAGLLEGFYLSFGFYMKFGDFKENLISSDSFNIGFLG